MRPSLTLTFHGYAVHTRTEVRVFHQLEEAWEFFTAEWDYEMLCEEERQIEGEEE